MESCVYKAAWVLPISGPPIRDGMVVVVGETIARVAPWAETEATAKVVDLGEAVLLPGMVDLSARLELTALRGVFAESRNALWIEDLARARYKVLQAGDFMTSALTGLIETVRGGVTTIADSGSTQAGALAMMQLGLQGSYYLEMFGPQPRQATEALEKTVRDLVDLAEILPSRIRIGVAPLALYLLSTALMKDAARLARRHELDVCVHAAESRAEYDFVHDNTGLLAERHRSRMHPPIAKGMSPLAHLDSLGLLEGAPLVVHGVHLDEADRARVRERGVRVAHCPRANATLGAGIAPVRELLDLGVPVGLGSSAAIPHAATDMLDEARTTLAMARGRAGDASAMSAETALRLATLEGARVLGLERRVGSLEAGKQADLIGVALPGAREVPGGDPTRALLAAASRRDVVLTVVNGRILHRSGERTELDEIEDTLAPLFADLRARLAPLGTFVR